MPTQRIVSRGDDQTLYECEAKSLLKALQEAVKDGADLRGAYLGGADLRGANLRGADLRGAHLDWTSHNVVAELLRSAAGESVERRMLAGLVLISRDWCWDKFLAIQHAERDWALDLLRGYVRDGDNAPDVLKREQKGTSP